MRFTPHIIRRVLLQNQLAAVGIADNLVGTSADGILLELHLPLAGQSCGGINVVDRSCWKVLYYVWLGMRKMEHIGVAVWGCYGLNNTVLNIAGARCRRS